MKKKLLTLFFLSTISYLFAQKYDYIWLTGYQSEFHTQYAIAGNTTFNFNYTPRTIEYESRPLDFFVSCGSISDPVTGRLLFATNNVSIEDSTKQMMLNGDSISFGPRWTNNVNNGGRESQGAFVLPKPNSTTNFILIHTRNNIFPYQNTYTYYADRIFFSEIDMRLNNGRGKVVQKNKVLKTGRFNPGALTACKHGNGRDWWVVTQSPSLDTLFRFLVSPNGVTYEGLQVIGYRYPDPAGAGISSVFAPNGEKFVTYDGWSGLKIYDFDRCNGLFANSIFIPRDSVLYVGGVSISPNSRYLYCSNYNYIYQIDLEAADIAASLDTVAVYDGFAWANDPTMRTAFAFSQLAPDGKIYITPWGDNLHRHIIENPNAGGAACNVLQHSIEMPTLSRVTMPHFPNYRLGVKVGSMCDTLLTPTLNPLNPPKGNLRLFPNPTSGNSRLVWDTPIKDAATIQITNNIGQVVKIIALPASSSLFGGGGITYHDIDLKDLPNGIYFVSLQTKQGVSAVKLVKVE